MPLDLSAWESGTPAGSSLRGVQHAPKGLETAQVHRPLPPLVPFPVSWSGRPPGRSCHVMCVASTWRQRKDDREGQAGITADCPGWVPVRRRPSRAPLGSLKSLWTCGGFQETDLG